MLPLLVVVRKQGVCWSCSYRWLSFVAACLLHDRNPTPALALSAVSGESRGMVGRGDWLAFLGADVARLLSTLLLVRLHS